MGVFAGFIPGLGGEFVLTARLLPTRDFHYTFPFRQVHIYVHIY
jgi:hypothetical protein